MVLTKDKIQNIDPRARVNLTKAIVKIVEQTTHLRNVRHVAKCAIHVTKRDTLSHIPNPDNEARARAKENGGLTQGSPDVINMK